MDRTTEAGGRYGPADGTSPASGGGGGPRDPGEVRRFYDALAPDYDRMTDFQSRLRKDAPVFAAIVRRFGIGRALDAGCGTGFHSILLARAGAEVTGIDLSADMVRRAGENASRAGVTIRFFQSALPESGGLVRPAGGGAYDAVFCLGNTLAHMSDDGALDATLENFRGGLRPGGTLIVQLLNYEKILAARKETLNTRKVGETTFERKYAYGEDHITFTVSMTGPERSRTGSVTLRPLTRPLLLDALRRSGFRDVRSYGSLLFAPYDAGASPDFVTVAVR